MTHGGIMPRSPDISQLQDKPVMLADANDAKEQLLPSLLDLDLHACTELNIYNRLQVET